MFGRGKGRARGIFSELFGIDESISITPPTFIRPSVAIRAGTPVENIDETPVITCPNTGLACPWLKDMAVLELTDEPEAPHFTETELRRMQHTLTGYDCLLPKPDSATMDSECYGSMAKQFETTIKIVQDRHKP